VFVSSHLMSEMQNTADHLIVIGRGQLLAACTMEDQSPWMPGASPRREVAVPLHLHALERRKGQRR